MKIFCLGLSRTGTTSLAAGLELLGFKAKHFPLSLFASAEKFGGDVFSPKLQRNLLDRWQLRRELKAQRSHDVLELLSTYDAFCDLPIPLYYRELDHHFSDAKFILTTRPINDWLKSMNWLLETGIKSRGWSEGPLMDELHYQVYGCVRYDEEHLTQSYLLHEERVVEYFKDRHEQFLKIDISKNEMNFETISPFLNCEIPTQEFPVNNRKD